jgi:diacylglycerol O-acyltransferase/trehalose O-mycolyltransferase
MAVEAIWSSYGWSDGCARLAHHAAAVASSAEGFAVSRVRVLVVGIALLVAACSAPVLAPASPSPSPTMAPPPTIAPSAPTVGVPADDGARIVSVDRLSERMVDLLIDSPAVGPVQVRLLLPVGFSGEALGKGATTSYPSLYLLHGGGGEYTDWTTNTHVEAWTAPTNLLVVMPGAGSSAVDGWYTDWQGSGAAGRPQWETFHLGELPQLLERNWRAGPERAVAGLSLGGYGSIIYAERNPGFFKAAASYSGVLDVTAYRQHVPNPNAAAIWGDDASGGPTLADTNPINDVAALDGTDLYISFGNGEPGPLDPPNKEFDELEAWVGEGDESFLGVLNAAGIPATIDAYGPGTHSWGYWDRELRSSLPMLIDAVDATGAVGDLDREVLAASPSSTAGG